MIDALRARGESRGVDQVRRRISLAIKRLGADLCEQFVDQLETGQTVDATVTRVMPCGAFVRVVEGVEGLIHVSELAGEQVADPHASVRAPRRAHMNVVRKAVIAVPERIIGTR